MGMLAALEALPVALFSMPAGAWCNHGRKLSMLFASRRAAAFALSTIALASWICLRPFGWRCYVAVMVGTTKAFGGSTEQVLLSAIIGHDSIDDVHNHFTAIGLAAHLLDLGIAGLLVRLLATAWAPIADIFNMRPIQADAPWPAPNRHRVLKANKGRHRVHTALPSPVPGGVHSRCLSGAVQSLPIDEHLVRSLGLSAGMLR